MFDICGIMILLLVIMFGLCMFFIVALLVFGTNDDEREYMSHREKSINGKYIGNAIGYCHSEVHPGALNHELAYKHKCIAKKCPALEKYDEQSWEKKDKYWNKSGKNKRCSK